MDVATGAITLLTFVKDAIGLAIAFKKSLDQVRLLLLYLCAVANFVALQGTGKSEQNHSRCRRYPKGFERHRSSLREL